MYLAPPIIKNPSSHPGQPNRLLPVNGVVRDPVSEVLSEVVNDVLKDHMGQDVIVHDYAEEG